MRDALALSLARVRGAYFPFERPGLYREIEIQAEAPEAAARDTR